MLAIDVDLHQMESALDFAGDDSGRALQVRLRVETPGEVRESLVREPAARPQILRQDWIIFGEFVVSFAFTDFRTLTLSN
jgi:hypothetical protein